jgi:asparagine synthase (glutamine-hydrolysing)
LPDYINFEVDRMSMASSVEARPPFLDHRLWELVSQVPASHRGANGLPKRLLREAMRGRLPEAILRRPKQGLATPHAAWWRRERLPQWAEEALQPAALRASGYFAEQQVARMRSLHRSGRADHSRLLMGVLTTQLWQQLVLEC